MTYAERCKHGFTEAEHAYSPLGGDDQIVLCACRHFIKQASSSVRDFAGEVDALLQPHVNALNDAKMAELRRELILLIRAADAGGYRAGMMAARTSVHAMGMSYARAVDVIDQRIAAFEK